MKNYFKTLPLREEETPIMTYNGYAFKNKAWHCRPEHMYKQTDLDPIDNHWLKQMILYFANFCEPIRNLADEIHCVACNAKLTGPYGMAHWTVTNTIALDTTSSSLEGRCVGCGYPLRCQHKIYLETGELLVDLQGLPLMYHPTTLEGRIALLQ